MSPAFMWTLPFLVPEGFHTYLLYPLHFHSTDAATEAQARSELRLGELRLEVSLDPLTLFHGEWRDKVSSCLIPRPPFFPMVYF